MTRWFHLFVLLAALASQPAFSQDSGAQAPTDGSTQGEPAASSDTPTPDDGEPAATRGLDTMVVTAPGRDATRFNVIQGTNVLEGEELLRETSATLGETLERQPGITSTGFVPGSARPVIRGLDGPRIRVLNNGVGTLDASVTSPDHQTAVEPLLMDRVEVIRGAGTLRFGSSGVGGVVNVLDGRIPTEVPENIYDATVRGSYGTNARDRAGAAAVDVGVGQFVIHGEGFVRRTNDFRVPGNARSDDLIALEGPEPNEPGGYLINTDIDDHQGGALGGSWVFDKGYLGASWATKESNYGLSGLIEEEHGEEGHGEEEEEVDGPRIDMEQDRYDFAGELNHPLGPFDQASFRAVYGDYEHSELEGDEVATKFTNEAWEGRFELRQAPIGDLDGTVGVQFVSRDFAALGAEAFVPQSDTFQFGIFAIEQLALGPFSLEGGFRYEHTNVQSDEVRKDLTFNAFSFSLGGSWSPDEDWLFGVQLTRTERAPIAEELFSNGPHLATFGFEVGDASLDKEIGWGLEATARKRLGPVTGSLSLFYNPFEDYIFQSLTGEEEDGLPVRMYVQNDAVLWGGELELEWLAWQNEHVAVAFDAGLDYVRGRVDGGPDLPRIPPFRARIGAEARSRYVDGRIEVWRVDEQNRTGPFELPTEAYTFLNASVAIRPMPDRAKDFSVVVEGRNLTDEKARNHVSFTKDILPLAGIDVRVLARLDF